MMTDGAHDTARACIARMQAAWNARDAHAYAALFTANATNITFFGDAVFDRVAMETKLAGLLATIPSGMTMTMKLLGATAIADGVISAVAITGVGTGTPYPLDKIQTITLVQADDGWRCAAFQNTTMGGDTVRQYNPAA